MSDSPLQTVYSEEHQEVIEDQHPQEQHHDPSSEFTTTPTILSSPRTGADNDADLQSHTNTNDSNIVHETLSETTQQQAALEELQTIFDGLSMPDLNDDEATTSSHTDDTNTTTSTTNISVLEILGIQQQQQATLQCSERPQNVQDAVIQNEKPCAWEQQPTCATTENPHIPTGIPPLQQEDPSSPTLVE